MKARTRRNGLGLCVGLLLSTTPIPAVAGLCAEAEIGGPDPWLVIRMRKQLARLGASSGHEPGCEPLRVHVERVDGAFEVRTRGQQGRRRRRFVSSPRVAASLISSWSTPGLDVLFWEAPGGIGDFCERAGAQPMGSPRPERTPYTSTKVLARAQPTMRSPRSNFGSTPATRTAALRSDGFPSSQVSVGFGPIFLEGPNRGLEAQVSWQRREPEALRPTARLATWNQPTDNERAGVRVRELGLGLQIGRQLGDSVVQVYPTIGAVLAWRHLSPSSAVGAIACNPSNPCGLNQPAATIPDSYQAFTLWGEAALELTHTLGDSLAIGVRTGVAVSPGALKIGAPSNPNVIAPFIRRRPTDAHWKFQTHAVIRWQGP